MRAVVSAIGSTGDVLPYLGLAQGLQSAGFIVSVATHREFRPWVEQCGLGFHELPMTPSTELTADRRAVLRRGGTSAARLMQAVFEPWARLLAFALDEVVGQSDIAILSTLSWSGVHSGEGHGVPTVGAHLQPIEPTSAFPPPVLAARTLGPTGNRLAGRLAARAMVRPNMPIVNELRAAHGLVPIDPRDHLAALERQAWPVLHGFSTHIVPRPADWRHGLDVTGYWWPPRLPGWEPDRELLDFISAGEAPVYVGFGSTSPVEEAELARIITDAVRVAGVRAVVQSGWSGLDVSGDEIHPISGTVDHHELFPRMSAVVHHSGAGTAGAAVRSGRPSVTVPVALDQPFWAHRLHRLGVGTKPIRATRLDSAALASALVAATSDGSLRERAEDLAVVVREEQGVEVAVERITKIVESHRRLR